MMHLSFQFIPPYTEWRITSHFTSPLFSKVLIKSLSKGGRGLRPFVRTKVSLFDYSKKQTNIIKLPLWSSLLIGLLFKSNLCKNLLNTHSTQTSCRLRFISMASANWGENRERKGAKIIIPSDDFSSSFNGFHYLLRFCWIWNRIR